MTYVALWRNVNVGQRGHPTAAQLCALMTEAGAVDARSFQSNGTVVFEAASLASAEQIGAEAATRLAALSPADRDVRVVSMERIRELVHEFGPAADVDRREITFHPGDAISLDSEAVRAAEQRARATVLAAGRGWVAVANHRDRQSNGTPLIEHVTGARATSRSVMTLMRLCDRFPD